RWKPRPLKPNPRNSCVGISGLELQHLLPLIVQTLDAEGDHVAGFHKLQLLLHAHADPRRRAGDDQVARLEDEILRSVPDQVPAIEDHCRGVAALALLAVDFDPHVEALRVLDRVLVDEPGPERTEGLAALALGPLSGALELKDALGDVIG